MGREIGREPSHRKEGRKEARKEGSKLASFGRTAFFFNIYFSLQHNV